LVATKFNICCKKKRASSNISPLFTLNKVNIWQEKEWDLILVWNHRIFVLKENLDGYLDKFSNIEQDKRKRGRVLGIRVQKLRGDFTPEEREARRIASMEKQKQKRELKAKLGLSRVGLNNV